MSLDNIQLPGVLFPLLFRDGLVDLTNDQNNKSPINESKLEYLGGNEKNITFVAKDSQSKFLNDSKMQFLNNLLTACNLTMADIAFVNFLQKQSITYRELSQQLNARKIIAFGLTAGDLDLPIDFAFFQIQNFQEKAYLICPSLEDLQVDKEMKKQLWNSLQKIFNIQKKK